MRLKRFGPAAGCACLVYLTAMAPGCGDGQGGEPDLVLLTRDGCVNTAALREHLDDALRALGQAGGYRVIDVDRLPATDPRGGYGTPTILYRGRDLFGLPVPASPHPPPT